MSGKDEGSQLVVGGVPIGIVKGGTSSSNYDRELAKRKADADARRAHEDQKYEIRRNASARGEAARIGSLGLVNQASPRIVLNYLNKDKTIRQQCKGEITMLPVEGKPNEWDMMFSLVCPRCVERGVPQGEAQMMVRDSHRKFTLNEQTKGQVAMLEYHFEGAAPFREPVVIAGTVSVHDIVRCDNYNCGFACRIDESNVIEV